MTILHPIQHQMNNLNHTIIKNTHKHASFEIIADCVQEVWLWGVMGCELEEFGEIRVFLVEEWMGLVEEAKVIGELVYTQ